MRWPELDKDGNPLKKIQAHHQLDSLREIPLTAMRMLFSTESWIHWPTNYNTRSPILLLFIKKPSQRDFLNPEYLNFSEMALWCHTQFAMKLNDIWEKKMLTIGTLDHRITCYGRKSTDTFDHIA